MSGVQFIFWLLFCHLNLPWEGMPWEGAYFRVWFFQGENGQVGNPSGDLQQSHNKKPKIRRTATWNITASHLLWNFCCKNQAGAAI